MSEQAIAIAAGLCRRFEGLRLKPYMCPAGIPTIGYGSTRYADGKAVTLRDAPITAAQAEELLMATLRRDYLFVITVGRLIFKSNLFVTQKHIQ